MLILGVEPSLIAYKTIMRTDTLYELLFSSFCLLVSFKIYALNHSAIHP